MIPSVGRIVHYKLGDYEVDNEINGRMSNLNRHEAGQVVPMLIVRVWEEEPTEKSAVNGRVFLDGQHSLWVTSRVQGDGLSQWSEPPRVEQAAPAPAAAASGSKGKKAAATPPAEPEAAAASETETPAEPEPAA